MEIATKILLSFLFVMMSTSAGNTQLAEKQKAQEVPKYRLYSSEKTYDSLKAIERTYDAQLAGFELMDSIKGDSLRQR